MTTKRPAKPRPPPEPVWATAKQLWTRYQISRSTWWRWTKAPSFPAPVRHGHTVRWDAHAVHRYLTRQKAKKAGKKS